MFGAHHLLSQLRRTGVSSENVCCLKPRLHRSCRPHLLWVRPNRRLSTQTAFGVARRNRGGFDHTWPPELAAKTDRQTVSALRPPSP